MENQIPQMKNFQPVESFYTVPKVSIDGQSHGDLLLMAVGSGATAAIVILIILMSLIKHKNESLDDIDMQEPQIRQIGEFTIAPPDKDHNKLSPELQKSNLMFRYFGKSLSSFDLERSEVPTNMEYISNERQFYKQNISFICDLNIKSEEKENDEQIFDISSKISC